MKSFRQFISQHKFNLSLREEGEAAPAMGAAPVAPESEGGETTNDNHFDALKRQLGMSDEEFQAAIEGGTVTLHKVPDFGWGFHPNPPVQATVEDRGDGTYNVTLMLSQMPANSFTLPYQDGETPQYFNGKIEDRTEVMTKHDLINSIVPPYEGGGMQQDMGMGGMGDPMMGGGMGAPPGGMM